MSKVAYLLQSAVLCCSCFVCVKCCSIPAETGFVFQINYHAFCLLAGWLACCEWKAKRVLLNKKLFVKVNSKNFSQALKCWRRAELNVCWSHRSDWTSAFHYYNNATGAKRNDPKKAFSRSSSSSSCNLLMQIAIDDCYYYANMKIISLSISLFVVWYRKPAIQPRRHKSRAIFSTWDVLNCF